MVSFSFKGLEPRVTKGIKVSDCEAPIYGERTHDMEESSRVKTLIRSYVVDDGWHLPKEIIENIDIRIAEAKSAALRRVKTEHDRHRGKWLNADAVRKYQAKSWVFRELEGNRYCGMVRKIGEELQEEYGVTELEAFNILLENASNVRDYLTKYYNIEHMIPAHVDEQWICDSIVEDYLCAAI